MNNKICGFNKCCIKCLTNLVMITVFVSCLLPNNLLGQSTNSAKPLLGWNSWQAYGRYPAEKAMLANIDAMAIKLKPFGYTYFVIDAGWDVDKDAQGNLSGLTIDKYGRYIPAKPAFPNGIKKVADYAHSKGLKFGVHIMRGIPRAAYKANLSIWNTRYTARDVADTNSICKWNKDNYGVNMSKAGAQDYYNSYIGLLISWGVDFIKADDITPFPEEVRAIKTAIRKTGKPVVLSLSPGDDSKIENVAAYNEGDMLRVTGDVWDNQKGFAPAFAAWKKWADVPGRKFWLDMDMIPFGHLCLQNPDPNYKQNNIKQEGDKSTHGKERLSAFTDDQKYTFISLRALSASPLFMGGDLPASDDFSFKLITDKDMLACNQNGVVGKLIYNKDGIEIWRTPNKDNPRQGWLGIFNRNQNQEKKITIPLTELGINSQKLSLYDIWKAAPLATVTQNDPLINTVNGNGVIFCRYQL